MRSLSPSRTLTWTRTVSPDRIAGRSVSCAFSTSSIALMSELLQDCLFFILQLRGLQQIGPPLQCPRQRLRLPPPPNCSVIPRQEYIRHAQVVDFGRPSVLRKIEHALEL